MSLRFAIIKNIKTVVGQEWEDVVYEYPEENIIKDLQENLVDELPSKRMFLNEADVLGAFNRAWKKTVSDFKKITLRIL